MEKKFNTRSSRVIKYDNESTFISRNAWNQLLSKIRYSSFVKFDNRIVSSCFLQKLMHFSTLYRDELFTDQVKAENSQSISRKVPINCDVIYSRHSNCNTAHQRYRSLGVTSISKQNFMTFLWRFDVSARLPYVVSWLPVIHRIRASLNARMNSRNYAKTWIRNYGKIEDNCKVLEYDYCGDCWMESIEKLFFNM